MCGIAGILRSDGQPVRREQIERQTDLIAHRGPDDAGEHVDGSLGLGHRRLSLVDLSAAGHQPMASADRALWIVFNGEIYNHVALREQLHALGHSFRSSTDTEVILAAWRQWGAQCVTRFEGMWAFALWDATTRRLFCSRDRLGIKPFYYARTEHGFVFGSEIKAVLGSGLLEPALQHEALRLQLVYRARSSAEGTCFAGVQQLPAGHNLLIGEGCFELTRYWNAADFVGRHPAGDTAQAFRSHIEAAVYSHLRGDVAVGACLSGGLDSATLVALAAPAVSQPLQTFSVTYPGTRYDESSFIHALTAQVERLQTHESAPDGSDIVEVLRRSTWHYEEPGWGGSVYSWWQVMKAVHAGGIKVVLNGQGADELLAGYPRYYLTWLRQLMRQGRLSELRSNFRGFRAMQGVSSAALLRDMATPYWPGWLRRVLRMAGRGQAYDDRFLSAELRGLASVSAERSARRAFADLDQHLLSDLLATRLPELLQAEDRFSMAFSIESRVPFLDRRVVEFALGLRGEDKLADGITKRVLREAMRDSLPVATVDRRDKQGYPTPVDAYLRAHAIEFASDLIASRAFRERGVFDIAAVDAAFARWRNGQGSLPGLWTWLSTEVWFQQYFDVPLTPLLAPQTARRDALA